MNGTHVTWPGESKFIGAKDLKYGLQLELYQIGLSPTLARLDPLASVCTLLRIYWTILLRAGSMQLPMHWRRVCNPLLL